MTEMSPQVQKRLIDYVNNLGDDNIDKIKDRHTEINGLKDAIEKQEQERAE